MTEKEVFQDLIGWLKNYPDLCIQYLNSKNKKESARKMITFRILKEPYYLYILPHTLLLKIGIKVILNPKVSSQIEHLARCVNGRISMVIKI